ncbi:hypothetical protein EDD36DRAFT_415505 [Exophiala viscosa]|uniref:Ecp2 effector protein domain-containing protein n=1 Tax=Exophiala viscosa TaxID=2486360 RepID=A0AAN6E1Q6_9EURO|nr:hypothetical protein EDD36DRAFT_415505 [Exophiala viscosa]
MGWEVLSFLLILSTLLFQTVSGSAASNDTTALDICAWGTDAMPILYHEYHEEDCPPVFHLKPDGNCSDYFIGVSARSEPPSTMARSSPMYGYPCVAENYAWKAKVNFNYKWQALTTGITGGYSEKSGISQGYKFNKQLQNDHDSNTVANACVEQLVDLDDAVQGWRSVRGIVVFVYVDCLTLQPLPDDQQDVAFTQPGVKLPRGTDLSQAYENLWNLSAQVPSLSENSATTCVNTGNTATNISDCVEAIGDALNNGNLLVDGTSGGKGHTIAAGAYDTCTVLLTFDEDWSGENCKVSYLEVAAAAQAILDDCIGDEQIGGAHMVRDQGDCASTVMLGNQVSNP